MDSIVSGKHSIFLVSYKSQRRFEDQRIGFFVSFMCIQRLCIDSMYI